MTSSRSLSADRLRRSARRLASRLADLVARSPLEARRRGVDPTDLPERPTRTRAVSEPFRRLPARALVAASGIARRAGWPETAVRLGVGAVRLDPPTSSTWSNLASLALSAGPREFRRQDITGLEATRIGDHDLAIAAAQRALEIEPRDLGAVRCLATGLERTGRLDEATDRLDAVLAEVEDAELHFRRGRIEAEKARRAGRFSDLHLDLHDRHLRRAVELDPTHHHARYHRLRVALRSGRWSDVVEIVEADSPTEVPARLLVEAALDGRDDDLLELVDGTDPDDQSADAWLLSFWLATDRGAHRAAFEAKDRHARALLDLVAGSPHFSDAIRRTRAHVCLGDDAAAAESIEELRFLAVGSRQRRIADKLAADVALWTGDAGPHQAAPVTTANEPSELAFRAAVGERSIAVIGPTGASRAPDADIVVTTASTGVLDERDALSHAPSAAAVYLADNAFAMHRHELADPAVLPGVHHVVIRPSVHDLRPNDRAGHRLRTCPSEDATVLEGSQFGIARIVYDVLRYGPTTVSIRGADLFTGRPRVASYRSPDDPDAGERVRGYGHDLRSDHRWLAALFRAGIIDADEELAAVLRLDTAPYLHAVERARTAERSADA